MTNTELQDKQNDTLTDIQTRLSDFRAMADKFEERTRDGFGPGDEQFAEWLLRKGAELTAEADREIAYSKFLRAQ
jgi:hypothetical protein